jgi:hypothetical protein
MMRRGPGKAVVIALACFGAGLCAGCAGAGLLAPPEPVRMASPAAPAQSTAVAANRAAMIRGGTTARPDAQTPRHGARRDDVFDRYAKGQPTGARRDASETVTIADGVD